MKNLNLKPRINIAVGGRFHSNFMARALLDAGYDVKVFTSLPRSRFFNLPPETVESLIFPEVIARIGIKLGLEKPAVEFLISQFGKSVAKRIARERNDVDLQIGWSSFSLETFRSVRAAKKIVVRGSTHIQFQDEVLKAEHEKLGLKYPDQSFVIDRETKEYELADYIIVPSKFAKKTFRDRGFSEEKVQAFWLGVDTKLFTPGSFEPSSGPLRLVYFGGITVRKGIQYLLEAAAKFSPRDLELTLVGNIDTNFKPILKRYPGVRSLPAMDRPKLNELFKSMDVFVMPTFEEGFSNSLIQAMAAGLVPISTERAGSSELISHGKNGFIVPVGESKSIVNHLETLLGDRTLLSQMKREAVAASTRQTWAEYGKNLTHWIASLFTTSAKTATGSR